MQEFCRHQYLRELPGGPPNTTYIDEDNGAASDTLTPTLSPPPPDLRTKLDLRTLSACTPLLKRPPLYMYFLCDGAASDTFRTFSRPKLR